MARFSFIDCIFSLEVFLYMTVYLEWRMKLLQSFFNYTGYRGWTSPPQNKVADATLFSAGSNFAKACQNVLKAKWEDRSNIFMLQNCNQSLKNITSTYLNTKGNFAFRFFCGLQLFFSVFTNLHIRKLVIISTRFQKNFILSYTLKNSWT